MAATDSRHAANFWGYLIQPDKSASPLLEQLCLGIAKIIGKLEPATDTELTPSRLAAFYRSVGGNYDSLFLKTDSSGLSYMYKLLGCFHSLQPTANPFESPCVPSLSPSGYVRWQTLQLLLSTDEHVAFIQEAVKCYNIPNPEGGNFPKVIPREAFPDKPDLEMERWHRMVTGSLEQAHQYRLKASPYPSPRDLPDRGDGYFASGRGPAVGRPVSSSRPNSNEREKSRLYPAEERRRSSVPDIPSPFLPGADPNYYWAADAQTPVTTSLKHSQSKSSQRSPSSSSQHRPSASSHRYSSSSHRTSDSSTTYRPTFPTPEGRGAPQPPQSDHYKSNDYVRQQHRSSTTSGRTSRHSRTSPDQFESSGSEGSSETSIHGRKVSTPKRSRDGTRRSSLFPPQKAAHQPRRHSHDATYLSDHGPSPPPRPAGYTYPIPEGTAAKPEYAYRHVPGAAPQLRNGNGVNFRNVWETRDDDAAASAPESPIAPEWLGSKKGPQLRYFDPLGRDRGGVGSRSNAGMDISEGGGQGVGGGGIVQNNGTFRKGSTPIRISTVTGVGGRKYAAAEPRGGVTSPQPAPMMGVAAGAGDAKAGSRAWL